MTWRGSLLVVAALGSLLGGCSKEITSEADITRSWECSFRQGPTTQRGHTAVTFSPGGVVSSQPRSGGPFRGRYTIANGHASIRVASSAHSDLNPVQANDEGIVTLAASGDELEIAWGRAPTFECVGR